MTISNKTIALITLIATGLLVLSGAIEGIEGVPQTGESFDFIVVIVMITGIIWGNIRLLKS